MTEELAMQSRCIHCGMEQYAPAVYGISTMEEPCCWCGETSKQMTVSEYYEAHRLRKEKLKLEQP